MASQDSWRVELLAGQAVPADLLDRIRFELETALNRFTTDVEARLRHEFALPALVVSSQAFRTSRVA